MAASVGHERRGCDPGHEEDAGVRGGHLLYHVQPVCSVGVPNRMQVTLPTLAGVTICFVLVVLVLVCPL